VKKLLSLTLLGAGLSAAQAPRPVAAKAEQVQAGAVGVTRAVMQGVEKGIDARLDLCNPADPADLLGNTRGVYLPGYGVVLTSEVALVKVAGLSPFHQTATPEERTQAPRGDARGADLRRHRSAQRAAE
jgi:hypothetical protein